ncbi:MAG: MoaD/ThiS family protein [Dehalococcoidales bacterium]|nr:MoaD/ThiS family protein [Dehalococcoidales bacterium]
MTDDNMITLNLQMYSWIAELFGEEETRGNILKRKVKAGTTLGEYLSGLAGDNPNAVNSFLDPSTGNVTGEVVIILNNRLVQYKNVKDTVLQDQDTLTLSPMLVGG